MANSNKTETADERRKKVMIGDLPEDFLRLSKSPSQQQISADEQAAMLLQQQMGSSFHPQNTVGKLHVTIAQAKLNKNYGMTRMDPYARLRVGHMIYETPTDQNGAKNPRWNKVIPCYLPQGVNKISIEIFDECAFTMDERIAWTDIVIPERVLTQNETYDDWFPLNGKLGEEKEGSINIILSLSPLAAQTSVYSPQYFVVPTPIYHGGTVPVYPGAPVAYSSPQLQQAHATQRQQPKPITEEDLKQVSEMFPDVEMEVIKSVMEANNANKDATINSLLSMST